MEYKRIYPDLAAANTALSVCFTAKELLSAEIDKDAIDFDSQYQKKTEFRKLFDLWKDPLYLADFFEANLSFFQDPYWNGISEETFVRDVVASSRVIFEQIEELIKSGELLRQFASLDDVEDSKRKRGKNYKVKAKYGYISNKVAFRFYGILLDKDTICITGGAIKIVLEMPDAPNTAAELKKMEMVARDLDKNDVFDKESFIDFITE